MDIKHAKFTGWLNAQVILLHSIFFSWQLFKLLAVLPKMTEHHVSVYEEPSLCKYFRKGCLLERQVEKFSRFMLTAYCVVQDGVVLP